jgi:hypothetical protein
MLFRFRFRYKPTVFLSRSPWSLAEMRPELCEHQELQRHVFVTVISSVMQNS